MTTDAIDDVAQALGCPPEMLLELIGRDGLVRLWAALSARSWSPTFSIDVLTHGEADAT